MVTKANLKPIPSIPTKCNQSEEFQESASQRDTPSECQDATTGKVGGATIRGLQG